MTEAVPDRAFRSVPGDRRRHFIETIGECPEFVIASELCGAFESLRFVSRIFMKDVSLIIRLVERKAAIYPGDVAALAVFFHDLAHCRMELFAERHEGSEYSTILIGAEGLPSMWSLSETARTGWPVVPEAAVALQPLVQSQVSCPDDGSCDDRARDDDRDRDVEEGFVLSRLHVIVRTLYMTLIVIAIGAFIATFSEASLRCAFAINYT